MIKSQKKLSNDDMMTLYKAAYDSFFAVFDILDEKKSDLSDLELDGLVHRFYAVISFSLDILNNYLASKGYTKLKTNKEIINLAIQKQVISDEKSWHLALTLRTFCHLSVDISVVNQIVDFINKDFQRMQYELLNYFVDEVKGKL